MREEQTQEVSSIHLEVAICFSFQIRAPAGRMNERYLDTFGRTAYEQLLQACLSDPQTRQRLLLYLAALEIEDANKDVRGNLYSLLSGEKFATLDLYGEGQHILLPHLVPGAAYHYWTTESGDNDELDLTPLKNMLDCRIVAVSTREINGCNETTFAP
jgi:hypothetical protein